MRVQQSCLNIMTETTINSILTVISIICVPYLQLFIKTKKDNYD